MKTINQIMLFAVLLTAATTTFAQDRRIQTWISMEYWLY